MWEATDKTGQLFEWGQSELRDILSTPVVFSFKDCEDIATITRPNETKERKCFGEEYDALSSEYLELGGKEPVTNAGRWRV